MDFHRHLDRALRRLRLEPSTGIQEFLAVSGARPSAAGQLGGRGAGLCDPKTWPKDPEKLRLPLGFVAAVGVHPKHANTFGVCYFDQLSRLVDFPVVTALGEVGLDCSEGAKPFAVQYSTLLWVLALERPYMPLVLHVRASEDGIRETASLYRRGLGALEGSQLAAGNPPPLCQWGLGHGQALPRLVPGDLFRFHNDSERVR